jgi:Na+-transporting NADH:ubiquinone oxidoreductase subunit NqrB
MSANGLATEAVTQLRVARNEEKAPAAGPNNAAAIDSAISALSTYIPAEAMALYLAVSSSLPVIVGAFPRVDPYFVYWLFVWGFSPGLFLLAYFVKLAKSGSQLPTRWQFPWFRLLSSIIAFGVWGRCVPGNPFAPLGELGEPGAGVFYGILATIVSIVLPSAEAICNWIIELRKPQGSHPDPNAGDGQ